MKRKNTFPLQIIIGILALVVMIVILAFAVVGGEATSLTPKSCSNPQTLNWDLQGTLLVEDQAFWGMGTEPRVVEVSSVRLRRLAIGEAFNWEVELVDRTTGETLSTDGGTARLVDGSTQQVPFSLVFDLKDNNCDGALDDTNLEIIAIAKETEDLFFKDESIVEQQITIRDGNILELTR